MPLKKEKLVCPCCKAATYDSALKETLGRKVWLWGTNTIVDRQFLAHNRNWACDACLSSKKALTGNPEAQVYCDFDPFLVYVDEERLCEKCGKNYFFTKGEQKYWYESLKFWVQSKPKHCSACRKSVREEKKLKQELSDLFKEKEKLTVSDMERLSEIYTEINKPDKSKYYLNLVNKAKRK
jgi:hypothetical protein